MKKLLFIMNNHIKQKCLHLLMIGVIVTLNNVWMANGDKSFIMRGINDQTDWDMVRYPYKSVYGLPKSLQCSESVYHQFNECEKSSHREWKVTIDGYFYETKQFCCFVWQAMACEIEKAAKCNQNYSQQIETNTRQLFTSVCDKISSSQRSWNCWWTEKMIITLSVAATVITVALIAVSAYLGCRQYRANAKLKEQAEIGKKFKISTKKLTTSDIGPPTNARKIQSSQISTTVDHSDKPEQNVEKQGKFRKWIGKIFSSSSSSKPNKNEKLTTKDIGQAKDTIPSTTTTNADHLDKPIELSEWSPQTPKKIQVQHVGVPPNSKIKTIAFEDLEWYPEPSMIEIKVEPLQSNKPIKNVKKQGKFRKWIGRIFSSLSSSKPNKNKKLTTKDIDQPKDSRRISSTTTTNADHIDDKPIEISEWNPQTPKKIQDRHVGNPSDYGIPKVNVISGLQPEELQEEQVLILQQQIQEQLQIQERQQIEEIRRLQQQRPDRPRLQPRNEFEQNQQRLRQQHEQQLQQQKQQPEVQQQQRPEFQQQRRQRQQIRRQQRQQEGARIELNEEEQQQQARAPFRSRFRWRNNARPRSPPPPERQPSSSDAASSASDSEQIPQQQQQASSSAQQQQQQQASSSAQQQQQQPASSSAQQRQASSSAQQQQQQQPASSSAQQRQQQREEGTSSSDSESESSSAIEKATRRKRSLLPEKQIKLMNKDDRKNSSKNLNRFISQSSSSGYQPKSNKSSTAARQSTLSNDSNQQNPIKTNITDKTKNLTELANLILRIPNNDTNTKYF
ncbi:uncharacterized protein LOC113798331 isoform X3 [Dermatophagoides pteronyssinus]|uniref:uncharacterized protein LOC113798331 isoform X3 n=1 Tax=Dermatophagoides pteronyssinus TaxID=6956 RepID=UPI003F680E61